MGSINLKHTGSGSDIALSSDGTSLLLDGTAIGGSPELYAELDHTYAWSVAPSATGLTAVAIGDRSVSAGQASTSIGYSYASGGYSTAISIVNNTTTYGSQGGNSVAIGQNAKTTNAGAIAIGKTSSAGWGSSVAIGRNATTTVQDQVAVNGSGFPVLISGVYTLPIADGTNGQVLTTNGSGVSSWATAGGGGASSIDDLSDGYYDSRENLAFGDNTSTIFANIDLTNTQGAQRNVAIGYGHLGYVTSGKFNIALGNNCSVFNETGSYNTAIGQNALQHSNTARGTGDQNVGIGRYAGMYNSTGSSNTFLGHNTNTVIRGGSNQTAVGFDAKVGATGATAITNSRASGADSFAAQITNNTTSYGASGVGGIAMGYQSKALGNNSIAMGKSAIASGEYDISLGLSTTASGRYSVAIGYNCTANHIMSASIGAAVNSTDSYQVNIGGSIQEVRISEAYTLPSDDGTASGQVLTTNGSGTVSWATPSSGGGSGSGITTGKSIAMAMVFG